MSYLCTFGCVAHVKNVGPGVKKLDDRTALLVFVGYENRHFGLGGRAITREGGETFLVIRRHRRYIYHGRVFEWGGRQISCDGTISCHGIESWYGRGLSKNAKHTGLLWDGYGYGPFL